MAYDRQFVLAIMRDGSPIREINGKVSLPFHSEYKVRLKNKHSNLRASAKVWIDGRLVSNMGDFILNPNQTLDIERFIDESMSRGNKFKFVPLSDGRVNDPTDRENGIVKVEFYREKVPFRNRPLIKPRRDDGSKSPIWRYDDPFDNYTNIHSTTMAFNSTMDSFESEVTTKGSIITPDSAPMACSAGATVEGSSSYQGFSYGDHFETEEYPVTVTLRLKGIDQRRVDWDDRPKPTSKKRIKFCPSCGARRHGMSKFCASCGTAYHLRYERERGRLTR